MFTKDSLIEIIAENGSAIFQGSVAVRIVAGDLIQIRNKGGPVEKMLEVKRQFSHRAIGRSHIVAGATAAWLTRIPVREIPISGLLLPEAGAQIELVDAEANVLHRAEVLPRKLAAGDTLQIGDSPVTVLKILDAPVIHLIVRDGNNFIFRSQFKVEKVTNEA